MKEEFGKAKLSNSKKQRITNAINCLETSELIKTHKPQIKQ